MRSNGLYTSFDDLKTYVNTSYAPSVQSQYASNPSYFSNPANLRPQQIGRLATPEVGAGVGKNVYVMPDSKGNIEYYVENPEYNQYTNATASPYVKYVDPVEKAKADAEAAAKKEAEEKAAAEDKALKEKLANVKLDVAPVASAPVYNDADLKSKGIISPFFKSSTDNKDTQGDTSIFASGSGGYTINDGQPVPTQNYFANPTSPKEISGMLPSSTQTVTSDATVELPKKTPTFSYLDATTNAPKTYENWADLGRDYFSGKTKAQYGGEEKNPYEVISQNPSSVEYFNSQNDAGFEKWKLVDTAKKLGVGSNEVYADYFNGIITDDQLRESIYRKAKTIYDANRPSFGDAVGDGSSVVNAIATNPDKYKDIINTYNNPAPEPEPDLTPKTNGIGSTINPDGTVTLSSDQGLLNADGSIIEKYIKFDKDGNPIAINEKLSEEDKSKFLDGVSRYENTFYDEKTGKYYAAITNKDGQEISLDLSDLGFTEDELARAKVKFTPVNDYGTQVDAAGSKIFKYADSIGATDYKNSVATATDTTKVNLKLNDKNQVVDENGNVVTATFDAPTTEKSADIAPTIANGMLINGGDKKFITTDDKRAYSAGDIANLVDKTKSVDMNVSPDSLVSNRLAGLLGKNNPYIQQAKKDATLQSARRGLLNSGAAAGFAQDAAIRAGYQIAKDDATAYLEKSRADQAAQNSLIEKGMIAKANALSADSNVYSQLATGDANRFKDIDAANAGINFDAAKLNKDSADKLAIQDSTLAFNTLSTNAGYSNTMMGSMIGENAQSYRQDAQQQTSVADKNADREQEANKNSVDAIGKFLIGDADRDATLAAGNAERTLKLKELNARLTEDYQFKNSDDILAALKYGKENTKEQRKAIYDSLTQAARDGTLAQNQLWRDMLLIEADNIKNKNAASNSLLSELSSRHGELATELFKGIWRASESMNDFERQKVRDELLHQYSKDEIVLTADKEMDLAILNNTAKQLSEKNSNAAQLYLGLVQNLNNNATQVATADGTSIKSKAALSQQHWNNVAALGNLLLDSESFGIAELVASVDDEKGDGETLLSEELNKSTSYWAEDLTSDSSKSKITTLSTEVAKPDFDPNKSDDFKFLAMTTADQFEQKGKSETLKQLVSQSPDVAIRLVDSMNSIQPDGLNYSFYVGSNVDTLAEAIKTQWLKSGNSATLKTLTSNPQYKDIASKVLDKLAG